MHSSYWSVISIPLSTWLLYIIIFAIAAFAGMAGTAYVFLLSYGSVLLALLFGVWIGANAAALRASTVVAAAGAFATSMLISLISFLLVLGIELHNAHIFAFMLMQNSYAPNIYGMASLAFGIWLSAVLIATLSSIVTFQITGRKNR